MHWYNLVSILFLYIKNYMKFTIVEFLKPIQCYVRYNLIFLKLHASKSRILSFGISSFYHSVLTFVWYPSDFLLALVWNTFYIISVSLKQAFVNVLNIFALGISFGNMVSLCIDSPGKPRTQYIDWPCWPWTHRNLPTCLPRAAIKSKCYHAKHIWYIQYMPWELNQKVGTVRQSKSWYGVDILGWFCDAERLQAPCYLFALVTLKLIMLSLVLGLSAARTVIVLRFTCEHS